MLRADRRIAAALCVFACLLGGCARKNTAPRGFLMPARQEQQDAFGGWFEAVRDSNGINTRVDGELLAITADSVWILTSIGPRVVATAGITKGTLTAWNAETGRVGRRAALGALSTISNGWILLLTFPMWILGGSGAAYAQSGVPVYDVPSGAVHELSRHARFPQGIPPGLDLSTLRRHR